MPNNSKKQFEVLDNETIEDCLKRMDQEGYRPIRRIEKPIFKEVSHNGQVDYEPAGRKIIFEGRKIN
ncbi:NETI motif-containing protein [Heyndrickxia camelliae]|uniref:NETI motif-containing protein n=1 Tax=Heyndrickxia camelliae TaxID=1707093 RepID=A0A2N3LHB8_9BACI|nr:NETI motif-containing protein [Heyndrickxia camelliae]PKR83967.1 NETI motif-containing protein [Heyndrickxia camelliae]